MSHTFEALRERIGNVARVEEAVTMSPNQSFSAAQRQRVVRVFVSSTFRDMHAERDELIKRIFPQLRKLCEVRGVTWGEVDLRWGVTDEQKAEGKVLPICLAEIHNCRPYFIGLLGERYGWVPDEIPQELVDRERWLAEHRGQSVTELEILHGVLNNPAMTDHALFYFRDPSFINSLPREQQSDFLEIATADEVARLGQEEAERRAEDQRKKLAALKARVRQSSSSHLRVREDYPTPKALGELVLKDLTELIDHLYPRDEKLDPLDRDALDHEAFAQSRSRVYIGRHEYFDRLNEHANGDGRPLVVLGESGSGKSAILANWAFGFRDSSPKPVSRKESRWMKLSNRLHLTAAPPKQPLLLLHFIGATPYSADWAAMLRRVMGEFKRHFEIAEDIPEQSDQLRPAFAHWMNLAATRGKVVLILDALNQLEDRDGAPDLTWLPTVIPSNIRLILSTLPGKPLDELTRRGWPVLHVKALEVDERIQLITDYLRLYTKSLSSRHAERIAGADQTANPLYLRALLDELRIHGDHFTLDQTIEHYLLAPTIAALYGRILERYEQDYERECEGLVRDATSLLWAARRGLSESELMDLLGTEQGPLPRAHWSPLYLAAEHSLVSRSGLIGFGHDYMRQAVQEKYLADDGKRQQIHLRLAAYFSAQSLGPRKLDELPWQFAEANAWEELRDLLTDREFLMAAWKADQFEVKASWARIERDSPLRIVESYRAVLDAPERDSSYTWVVASLLVDTGHPEEALPLQQYLVDYFQQTGDKSRMQACIGNYAMVLTMRGDLDQAMRLYKEQEQICRALSHRRGLSASLSSQASVLFSRGELDKALGLYRENERLCREMADNDGVSRSLAGQALIFDAQGQSAEAMRLDQEVERICRELGNRGGLERILNNRAVILYRLGELDEAMRLYREVEQISRELGDKQTLLSCLGNQAVVLLAQGEMEVAMRLLEEQEIICRELSNKEGLAACLGNQAVIHYTRGELNEAVRLHEEEERIYRGLGNKNGLQQLLCNQALILKAQGDLDGAMRLHKEQQRLCEELGSKDGLSTSLGNQAGIHFVRGELEKAMSLFKEQERICRELGNKDGLSIALGGQAGILKSRGQLNQAMELYKEEERICRELRNKEGLQICFGNQAVILKSQGALDDAMRLYKEQERICGELGNKKELATALIGQALIIDAGGDSDEAMRLYKEAERICRELGNDNLLQACLCNQANILRARWDLEEAMTLHKEAERLCRELGNLDGLQRSLGNQAAIFVDRRQLDDALRLYKEKEAMCRELGNQEALAMCLISQAVTLSQKTGRHPEALPLAEEAYRLATSYGLIALSRRIESDLEWVRSRA